MTTAVPESGIGRRIKQIVRHDRRTDQNRICVLDLGEDNR